MVHIKAILFKSLKVEHLFFPCLIHSKFQHRFATAQARLSFAQRPRHFSEHCVLPCKILLAPGELTENTVNGKMPLTPSEVQSVRGSIPVQIWGGGRRLNPPPLRDGAERTNISCIFPFLLHACMDTASPVTPEKTCLIQTGLLNCRHLPRSNFLFTYSSVTPTSTDPGLPVGTSSLPARTHPD